MPDDDAAAPDALSPAEVAALGAALPGSGPGSGPTPPTLIAGAFNPAMAERLRDWLRTAGRAGSGKP